MDEGDVGGTGNALNGGRSSRHLQLRLEALPPEIQAISWKAQVRLCKCYRHLTVRGKHVNQVVVAIAREMAAFAWAIARLVPVAA